MTYNPYTSLTEESSYDNASGTTLVDDKKTHYRDDSQSGVPKKVQFNDYPDPHAIHNGEQAPLVRHDLEYAEPYKNAATTRDISRTPEQQAFLNRRIEDKKQGIGCQKHPFVGRGLLTI
jgi:hypothetical protein